ncbi:hypothetical protein LINPERHAP1_LOCUS3187, partial [Linum perenne]
FVNNKVHIGFYNINKILKTTITYPLQFYHYLSSTILPLLILYNFPLSAASSGYF